MHFAKMRPISKPIFKYKKGPLENLRGRKSTLSGPHIPVPTFPLSTPPPPGYAYKLLHMIIEKPYHFHEHVFLPKLDWGNKVQRGKFDQHMILLEIGIRKLVVSKEEPETERTLPLIVGH